MKPRSKTGLKTGSGPKPEQSGHGVAPDMNVTPLVDVVLVLLIIFMVIAPITTGAFGVRIPPKPDAQDQKLAEATPDDVPVLIKLHPDGELTVNDVSVEPGKFSGRLNRVLNARKDRLIYMDAATGTRYGAVLDVINSARDSGADPIVLVPDKP